MHLFARAIAVKGNLAPVIPIGLVAQLTDSCEPISNLETTGACLTPPRVVFAGIDVQNHPSGIDLDTGVPSEEDKGKRIRETDYEFGLWT
jgi:hypothetical protein